MNLLYLMGSLSCVDTFKAFINLLESSSILMWGKKIQRTPVKKQASLRNLISPYAEDTVRADRVFTALVFCQDSGTHRFLFNCPY